MATTSQTLTAGEKKDLQSLGWVEGSPNTIPDNVSPVLKAKIQAAYNDEQGIANSQDLPDATSRQNQMVRERVAADGDADMQKVLNDQQAAADKQTGASQQASTQMKAQTASSAKPQGATAKRQNEATSK